MNLFFTFYFFFIFLRILLIKLDFYSSMTLNAIYKVPNRYILILLLKIMAVLLSYRQNKSNIIKLLSRASSSL